MASTALNWALNNGMSQAQFDKRIFDYVAQNLQTKSPAELRIEMDRLGVSPEDVARATGVSAADVQAQYTVALPKTREELIAKAAADAELAIRTNLDVTASPEAIAAANLRAATSKGLLGSETDRITSSQVTSTLSAAQKASTDKFAADQAAAAKATADKAAADAAAKIAADKIAADATAAAAASKVVSDKAAADKVAIDASNASSVDKAAAAVAAQLAADKAAADKIAADKAAADAVTAKATADKAAADKIAADKAAVASAAATDAGLKKTAADKAAADKAAADKIAADKIAADKIAADKIAADAAAATTTKTAADKVIADKIAADAAAAAATTAAAKTAADKVIADKIAAERLAATTGTRSAGLAYALNNGMTQDQYYRNIFQFYSKNSGLSDSMLKSEMDRLGISPQDVAAATGVTLDSVLTRYNAAKATTPEELAVEAKAKADLAAREAQWAAAQKANETAWKAQEAKNAADWAAQQKLTQNAQSAFSTAPLTLGQKFGSYESIPIGAQYNPAVTPGGVSPYSMVMKQMTPFQNPYASFVPGTPLGGFNPNLYSQIATNNANAAAAKAAADTKAANDALLFSPAGAGDATSATAAATAADSAAASAASATGTAPGSDGSPGSGAARGGYVFWT